MMHAEASDDLEIENVEYLEENHNVVEYIEEPSEKEELEDFYPNAIHCLLDLYKTKYESFNAEEGIGKLAKIWRDIANDMQESFFEFNERQIQHQYVLLRTQYFNVRTKEDIDNFDYFEQLHNIYKDPFKDNIVKGLDNAKVSTNNYKDEILLKPEHMESPEEHLHDFKSEEIVHKEHEFIDMVEKELQAMEDGIHIEDNKETEEGKEHKEIIKENISPNTLEKDETLAQQPLNVKRLRFDTEIICEEPSSRKPKLNDCFISNELKHEPSSPNSNNDFNLYLYNQEQERRHREKITLFEKSLQIQERALDQQQQLLQELIKRLSP